MMKKHPKVSIVIITLVRPSLYPLMHSLLNQKCSFDFDIILIPQDKVDLRRINDMRVSIFEAKKGLGVAFYRNMGIQNSKSGIIAFIDDDEMPKDEKWLKNLVDPIQNGQANITTSGTDIPLEQGYIADCISLLGYPGGAALGFKALWDVDKDNLTDHLCTGNFAAKRSLFNKDLPFNEGLKHGTEDVFFSNKLKKNGEKILYVPEATINHLPRKNIFTFVKWHFTRGRAISQYRKLKLLKGSDAGRLVKISFKVLKNAFKTPYFPMVLILLPLQYLSQFCGFIYESFKK